MTPVEISLLGGIGGTICIALILLWKVHRIKKSQQNHTFRHGSFDP
nr:uncharacterized protein CTRU02_05558 [Colletotrichum truncatum]KAF6794001.1 hypothetical protein CTRU02_05558 [Colletotrichum truncatum]